MSELQRFLPKDQDLLVSVFYRVGYWISHVDDTDIEDESEALEQKQMMVVLQKIAKAKSAGSLINELAAEAARQKQSWKRWEAANDTVQQDIQTALDVVKGQSNQEETKSFAKALMMIATSVAHAFREVPENEPEQDSYFSWLADTAGKLVLSITDREMHKALNVSPAEDTALNELANILKL